MKYFTLSALLKIIVDCKVRIWRGRKSIQSVMKIYKLVQSFKSEQALASTHARTHAHTLALTNLVIKQCRICPEIMYIQSPVTIFWHTKAMMISLAYFIPLFRLWNKLRLLTLEIQTKRNSLYLYKASTELWLCVCFSMDVVWLFLFIWNTGIKICVKVNLSSLLHISHCHIFFIKIVGTFYIHFMSLANIREAVKSWHYLWKPNFLFHLVDILLYPNILKNLDTYSCITRSNAMSVD
jgi:hypothetical protein